jgi:hypothetical protein
MSLFIFFTSTRSFKIATWVASAAAKLTDVPFYYDMPPGFAASK